MSIISIAAYGSGTNLNAGPFSPASSSTRSVTQLATGAVVTTLRGSTGDIVSVTTSVANQAAQQAQPSSSTVDITA